MPSRTNTPAQPTPSSPGALVPVAPRDARPFPKAPKPDLVERAARGLWTHRAVHGPVSVPGLAYLAALAAYSGQGGQDLATVLGTAVVGAGAIEGYRFARRRAQLPSLTVGQHLWQYAVTGAATVYLAVSSVVDPHETPMLWVLGALSAPLGATWWLRKRLVDPQQPEPPAEPCDAAPADQTRSAAEDDDKAARYAAAWAEGLACTGGKIPGSAFIDIRPNPPEAGGGYSGRAVLAAEGGAVHHTPDTVVGLKDLILQTFLRVDPEIDPTNLLLEPQRNGSVVVSIFDRNPLATSQDAQPSGPGTYDHRCARTADGSPVLHRAYVPGFGRRHSAAIGSTGSGKSSLMNLLIGLDGHTLTADGRPLVCPIICDPHEGVSYSTWDGRVRLASSPEQIAGALLLACIVIKLRLKWMKRRKVDLIVPSPEMPMIVLYLDEVLQARAAAAAAGYPLDPMLEVIMTEGRKTLVVGTLGMISFDTDSVGSTKVLDAMAQQLYILRSDAASTGLKINTGMWAASLNPQNIISEFSDGTPATGYGYHLRNKSAPQTVRYDRGGPQLAQSALFADAGAMSHVPFTTLLPEPDEKGNVGDVIGDLEYWVEELGAYEASGNPWSEWAPYRERSSAHDDEDDQPAAAAAAADEDEDPGQNNETRPSLLDLATGAARDAKAWETLRDFMSRFGAPISLDDLHTATNIKKSTISMAFSRCGEDEVVRVKQGVWVLPEHQHVPYTGGISR